MASYPVPTDANSLVLRGDLDLRIFIAVKNKPLPVFNLARAGDSGVQAFIPSAPGVVFEVVLHNGRKKPRKSPVLVELWFGPTSVDGEVFERDNIDYKLPLDAPDRFFTFKSILVGKDKERLFEFGPIPTTDANDAAKLDLAYLDSVSAIQVKTYTITYLTWNVHKEPKPKKDKKKGKQVVSNDAGGKERNASDSRGAKAPAATGSGQVQNSANGSKDAAVDEANDRIYRKHEKSLLPIDETSDKGQFGLVPSFGPLLSRFDAHNKPVVTEGQADGNATRAETDQSAATTSTTTASQVAPAPDGSAGSPSNATQAGKMPEKEKPEKWHVPKWKGQTLDGTYTFFLRSLPWISKHLDAFFFEPTPVLPPPEPTVQLGDVLYVDTSEQDAQADANASGPPKKRTKLTSGPDNKTGKGAQNPIDDDDAEMQDGEYGGPDYYDWDSDLNNGPDDALQLLATTAAQRPRPVSAATEAVKVTSSKTQQGAAPNEWGAKVPPVALTDVAAPTAIQQSAAAPNALPQPAVTSTSASSGSDVAARASVTSTTAPLWSRGTGEAGADITSSHDDVDEPRHFMIDTPAFDLLAASNYASNAASNLFRRMVKQDPQLGLHAEQTVLALPSQVPSIPTQQPAAQIDASRKVGSSRDLPTGASSSLATSGPARTTMKSTKTFQSRQARKPSSTTGAPIGGMPYRHGGLSGGRPSLKM